MKPPRVSRKVAPRLRCPTPTCRRVARVRIGTRMYCRACALILPGCTVCGQLKSECRCLL